MTNSASLYSRLKNLFLPFVLASLCSLPLRVQAQSQFEANSGFVEDVVLANLPISTAVAFAPDNRIFIAIKDGIVRVAQNGTLLPTPFLDINTMVNRHTDRGLGGIAVDPGFPARPYVYLFFTYDPPGYVADESTPRVSRLIRVQADPAQNYNVAKANTTEIILGKNSVPANIASQIANGTTILPEPASCMTGLTMDGNPIEDCIPSDERSHTAGTLIFAADGSLYVSHGDGAPYSGATKVQLRSQNIDSLAGKVMRIDPDTGLGLPGNPFFDSANPNANRSRVWSYGMRNPFRITVNPANGQAYIGDVGSSAWEEINSGKGANLGWPCYEGGTNDAVETAVIGSGNTASLKNRSFANFSRTSPFCTALYNQGLGAVTAPLFAYKHPLDADGKDLGASVTGVAFYSGNAYPLEQRGALFIADYAQHVVRYLTFGTNGFPTVKPFAKEISSGGGVVQLLAGPDTNIYGLYLNYLTKKSELRRYRYTGSANTPPTVVLRASPSSGGLPLTVSFNTNGTNDADGQALTYLWNFGDGSGASSAEANPTYTYTTVGTFEARVLVKEQTAPFAESTASIVIRTGVTPPKVRIDLPTPDTTYQIGESIPFSGYAEFDGVPVPDSKLSWSIIQLHNQHEHLVGEFPGVRTGSFMPTEHSDNTRFMVCLYASVAEGQSDQGCVVLQPRTTEVTFASAPVGATISYIDEDYDALAPYVAHPIVNSEQTISAAPVHANRTFVGWSDGVLARERTFIVGSSPTTFTALYENKAPVAQIKVAPIGGVAPITLQFDASLSTDPENSALSYDWDFGNGQVATTKIASASYDVAGTYSVQLTVTDALGLSNTVSRSIVINEPGTVNAAPVVQAPLPQTLIFGNQVSLAGNVNDDGLPAGTLDILWSRVRGPGSIAFTNSNAPTTTANFTQVGTYLVKLEATDGSLRGSQNTAVTLNAAGTSFGVTSFSLINADTDEVIPGYESIINGSIIPLKNLGTTALNIRANVTGTVGSVSFLQDAALSATDTAAPFSLVPGTGTDYPAWPYTKKSYILTAIPYSGSGGTGSMGAALTIQFAVKDTAPVIVPTATATATPTSTNTPVPTSIPTVTASPTSTSTATPTETAVSTATASATSTSSPTTTITATATSTNTPAAPVASVTATATSTVTATPTASSTNTATATSTSTIVPPTATATVTNTVTATPTASSTSTATATSTNTSVPPTATATATNTVTATPTASSTNTATATSTNTPVPPTATATATATNTVTTTPTASPINTATSTSTPVPPTATVTATVTRTPTSTSTAMLPTATATATRTVTATPTKAAANQAPFVDPGLAQTALFGSAVAFNGVVTDDGLPSNALSTLWSRIRGPGTISFGSPTTASTNATFSLPGTYLVKLAASDGALQSTKNGIVSINPTGTTFGITSFSLINAKTGLPFAGYEQVQNGATISLSALGSSPQINVRANTSGSGIGSVQWLSDAASLSMDNSAPYAIAPTTGASYGAWAYKKQLWRVTAVPFSGSKATGAQGAALSIQFTIK